MFELKMRTLRVAAVLAAGLVAGPALATDAEKPSLAANILAWTPEQQAYGYRHMEEFAPVRVIPRGEAEHELPVAEQAIDPKFTVDSKTWDTASYMEAFRASGVLVIKDGKIVLERYSMGRASNERWTSFSVAKSVTSTLVGAAIKDGKIKSLDDPVTHYIPELKGSAYEGATVRHLLTMTSGVAFNEDYEDPNSDVARCGFVNIEPGVNPIVSYMRDQPRAAAPGTKFNYNSCETDLAGILVSNAVGKPLAEYLSEKIWKPFGMEQDGVWVTDRAGHERGGCCISMTLRDYGRFGQFMLEGGNAGGQDILPAGWIADATSPHVAEPPYGYFWWLGPGGYEAEGVFGQTVTILPDEHLVVVINSAWPSSWDLAIDAMRWKYIAAIREAVK